MDDQIKQYGKRLFGLCMTLCKNQADAWDLYQDTWLRALEKKEQFHEDMPYEHWLTSICVNRYRDQFRRKRIAPFFDFFTSTEEKDQVLTQVPQEEKNDFSDVKEAVNRLPDKYRETVILFYFENQDVNNTAKLLKIPPGTVKSRLMKARKILKEELQDEWDIQFRRI